MICPRFVLLWFSNFQLSLLDTDLMVVNGGRNICPSLRVKQIADKLICYFNALRFSFNQRKMFRPAKKLWIQDSPPAWPQEANRPCPRQLKKKIEKKIVFFPNFFSENIFRSIFGGYPLYVRMYPHPLDLELGDTPDWTFGLGYPLCPPGPWVQTWHLVAKSGTTGHSPLPHPVDRQKYWKYYLSTLACGRNLIPFSSKLGSPENRASQLNSRWRWR